MGLYVVMGVSGAGKSLIGERLARALDVAFVEGDQLHSARSVARMAAGIALTDDDRREWLARIAARIREAADVHVGVVVACSALKRRYRDVLREGLATRVRFILLEGERALLAERLAARRGHFMPVSLLDSQLATLEPPSPEEHVWRYAITESPEAIVRDITTRIARESQSGA